MLEFPALQKVHQTYGAKGLTVLAITSDDLDSIRRVKRTKKVTFTVLRDAENKVSEAYGVNAIPRTVIVDKDGIVRDDITGAEDFNQFQDRLKKVGL